MFYHLARTVRQRRLSWDYPPAPFSRFRDLRPYWRRGVTYLLGRVARKRGLPLSRATFNATFASANDDYNEWTVTDTDVVGVFVMPEETLLVKQRTAAMVVEDRILQFRQAGCEDFGFEIFLVAHAVGATLDHADFVVEPFNEAERNVVRRLAVRGYAIPIAE
jgi:hypothetical protein